jgi:transcriptional regulator
MQEITMKKQNLQKELYPILENESIKIGTFKASRSIDTLYFIKENIKFWKSYDGHKLPEKQVKRAYYNGTRTQNIIKLYRSTPELIKFVREHANDYKTLNLKDVPSCITIDRRRDERYFSVYIEKFGNVRFDEVLRVFPLLPKSYLNK